MMIELAHHEIDTWPAAAVIIMVLIVILWRRKHSISYLACFFIFGIYVLFAVDTVFFPIRMSENPTAAPIQVWLWSINLIPLRFNLSELPNMVLLQIFENILLTIPFGFGVNFLAPVRGKTFLWLSLTVGTGIEAAQFAISLLLGYPYRIIDVNDALLNALGVLFGYGIFRVFAWLYVWMTQHLRMEHRGLAAYLYDIANDQSGAVGFLDS